MITSGPRFKLDENLPSAAELLLRDSGYDVETVLSEHLGGTDDRKVLDACRNEGRVLITLDQDFGDIRTYEPSSHCGVWVLRPQHQTACPSPSRDQDFAAPTATRVHR